MPYRVAYVMVLFPVSLILDGVEAACRTAWRLRNCVIAFVFCGGVMFGCMLVLMYLDSVSEGKAQALAPLQGRPLLFRILSAAIGPEAVWLCIFWLRVVVRWVQRCIRLLLYVQDFLQWCDARLAGGP